MGFMGQMALSMLNGMLRTGGKFSDQLYMTAKVKVRSGENEVEIQICKG